MVGEDEAGLTMLGLVVSTQQDSLFQVKQVVINDHG